MTVDLSFCVRAVSLPQGPRPDGELDLVARSTTPNTPFGKSEIQKFCIFKKKNYNTKYAFWQTKNPKNSPGQMDLVARPTTPKYSFWAFLLDFNIKYTFWQKKLRKSGKYQHALSSIIL